jgi:hypothetical protein
MPDMPNSGSNRKAQIAGLGNQAKSLVVSAVPDSSLLRSPKASDGEGGALGETLATQRGNTVGVRDNAIDLAALNGLKVSRAEMNMLPTPTAIQARNATSGRQEGSQHHGGTTLHDLVFDGTLKPDSELTVEMSLLPTPSTMEHLPPRSPEKIAESKLRSPAGYSNLREKVVNDLLPTPTVADQFTANLASTQHSEGSLHSVTLAQLVNRDDLFPTPVARDYKDGQAAVSQDGVTQTDTLGRGIINSGEVSLLPTTTASDWKGANHSGSGSASSRGISTVSENLVEQELKMLPTLRASDSYERRNRKTMQRIADEGGDMTMVTLAAVTTNWGKFQPAIERWETVTGRLAPAPTKPDGKEGSHRLSSDFTEWMMGLPAGWITNAGVGRNAELKMAGNGVVPQQAALAIRLLLERITT